MSDINIPGVSSRFNTDKMIERLMEVERIPLTRLEDQLAVYKNKKNYCQDINRSITRVRDTARNLYSFQNPFLNRKAFSSDPGALSATADRTAVEEKKELRIIQVAAADRFLSGSLPRDFRVLEGDYKFTIGEKEVGFNYKGGTLTDFADTVNRRGRDLISARVIRNTQNTQVILFESLQQGSDNRLQFENAALELALKTETLKKNIQEERSIKTDSQAVQAWTRPVSAQTVSFDNNEITLKPSGEVLIPVNPPLRNKNLVLEITVQIKNLPEDSSAEVIPEGPAALARETIQFEGIILENEPSKVDLPIITPPPKPIRVDNLSVLYASDGRREAALPALKDTEDRQTIEVPLSTIGDSLNSVMAKNSNTHREISIQSIRIYDPTAIGDFSPLNPLSVAQDSLIEMDGIEVVRKGNVIDDLIPGVTLNLLNPSDKKITLSVEPDREGIKESIINFIGHYNRLLAEINILTSRDANVIEEIGYFTDTEREKAGERLGAFQGESTLTQMRSRLQTIMMNPYTTSLERELSLLAQIGISTNATRGAAGYDASRLRGYLEMNEETFDAALLTKLNAVRELFGNDTDGDLVIDSGVAFALDTYARAFVDTGGIISYRIRSIDNQISSTNRDISSMQDRLVQKERDIQLQYGIMEGDVNTMERSSQNLDNLPNQVYSRR